MSSCFQCEVAPTINFILVLNLRSPESRGIHEPSAQLQWWAPEGTRKTLTHSTSKSDSIQIRRAFWAAEVSAFAIWIGIPLSGLVFWDGSPGCGNAAVVTVFQDSCPWKSVCAQNDSRYDISGALYSMTAVLYDIQCVYKYVCTYMYHYI